MGPKVEELYWCVVNIPSGDISKGVHFSFFPLESHKMNFVNQDFKICHEQGEKENLCNK